MLRNCEKCNRVFAHPTRSLCADCYAQEQQSFALVKDYLGEHPQASVAEVVQETGVDLETIYEFIRTGRLNIIPRDVRLTCEICGDVIQSGRVCAQCRAQFQGEEGPRVASDSVQKPKGKDKIRYLDQIRKRR